MRYSKIQKICLVCQSPYLVPPSQFKRRKFCSFKCYWENKLEENPSYAAVHNYIKKHFGKADKCENPECSGESHTFDWALIKGQKYERKRESFWKLCRTCHICYDMTDERRLAMSRLKLGTKMPPKSEELKNKLRILHKGKHYSKRTEFKKGLTPWNKGKKGLQVTWNKGLKN